MEYKRGSGHSSWSIEVIVPRPTQPDIAPTQEKPNFEKRAIRWVGLLRLHELRADRYRYIIENLSVESTCHIVEHLGLSTGTWNRTQYGQLGEANLRRRMRP